MNRTYRSLNDPVKLLGFTVWQWLALILTGAVALGATELLGVPVKPALSVGALVLTTVAAIAMASEPGGIAPLGLLGDLLRATRRSRAYVPGAAPRCERRRRGVRITGTPGAYDHVEHVDRAADVFVP